MCLWLLCLCFRCVHHCHLTAKFLMLEKIHKWIHLALVKRYFQEKTRATRIPMMGHRNKPKAITSRDLLKQESQVLIN